MVKEIEKDLEKLGERCEELDVKKENTLVRETTLDLKETLREYKEGVGLAAPQIGVNKRMFVMRFANNEYRTFINPVVTEAKGFELSREGCLSLPGKEYLRPRNNEITAVYQTPLGQIETRKFIGLAARIFQHELDHLEGLTLADMGLELPSDFDTMEEDARASLIRDYIESLDLKQKAVEKEIEEDPELKKINDGIEFTKAMVSGKVQVEKRPFTEEEMQQARDKAKELNTEGE